MSTHPTISDTLEGTVDCYPDRDAIVYPRKDQRWSDAEFDEFVLESDRLADFKRPRAYYFVDDLPTNPDGQIQKFKLRADKTDVDPESETVAS